MKLIISELICDTNPHLSGFSFCAKQFQNKFPYFNASRNSVNLAYCSVDVDKLYAGRDLHTLHVTFDRRLLWRQSCANAPERHRINKTSSDIDSFCFKINRYKVLQLEHFRKHINQFCLLLVCKLLLVYIIITCTRFSNIFYIFFLIKLN